MKIFLNAYIDKNLGDDLFVDLIVNRYKNVNFCTISYQKKYFDYENLKIIHFTFLTRCLNKIIKIISDYSFDLYSVLANQNRAVVTIGGSMFMESEASYKVLYYNNYKIPYFIIGTNVGPYQTDKYLSFLKENIFQNAKDICFRDKKSFTLFNKLDNVRYAPDLLFSLNMQNYKIIKPTKKKVIISVIDVNKKFSQIKNANCEKYETLIIDLINYFENLSYCVELISFCKDEGDDNAIQRILLKYGKNVNIFSYSANISETITELSTATTIVGTRFHANILGFLLNKNVIPIIYNDKTKNMLKDINFAGAYFDISDSSKMDINNLKIEDLDYLVDVKEQIRKSNDHFLELDKFMNMELKNERE